MPNTIVVGAQWGDEAKGKLVDCLAQNAGMVVRFGGGNNAGHTVTAKGVTYKFHLIPSGILNPDVQCVIADGVVVDPSVMCQEILDLTAKGLSPKNLFISNNAHVVMPYHRLFDQLEEKARGKSAIGTTGRGIGPTYVDKAARVGIRMHELIDPKRFEARLREVVEYKNLMLTKFYEVEPVSADDILEEYSKYADVLRPYVTDTSALIGKAVRENSGIVFEGAQGTLLDIDLGTYPFVTSSHPIAGGACVGTGIGPTNIDAVMGVAKSYTTRVGSGVFPTELKNGIGDYIRERGHEYGTTTGRPRRCGWLDILILKFAVQVNGLSCLSLGHLDVLAGLDTVKIGVGYKSEGEILNSIPCDLTHRDDIETIYEELPGWKEEISDIRSFDDLPINAQRYVRRVEQLAGVPIASVSVGPAREETIVFDGVMPGLKM
ncbi:MAG: adenylosuccinate synthase [Chthonomonadales bacterium]